MNLPAHTGDPAVTLDGVTFRHDGRAVLQSLTLHLPAGQLVGIVGPNGAGKSTLLRLVAGLLSPSQGVVRCFGADPRAAPRRRVARQLAYLPQDQRHTFAFSVSEVVLMGRYAHGRGGFLGLETAADLRAAAAAMARCDVLPLRDRRFSELSGGEQRRVLLAQALCQEAGLLLLDEPTASLDPGHAIALMREVVSETRQRAVTAVVVTHDLNLAIQHVDRLLLLHHGQLAGDGAPVAVLSTPAASAAFGVAMHVGRLPGSAAPFVVPDPGSAAGALP
jgi:iron complex transport system ATP-binding protein